MAKNLRKWRDSATLLLVARQTLQQRQIEQCNYKIMTMKRSSGSSFYPDTHVFAGGAIDKADCSLDWLKLYKKFGINDHSFDLFKNVKYAAPIFKTETENTIPRYISLRICAIRETFEECGVLLCKSSKQENKGNFTMWASYFGGKEVNEWQKKIHDDASQFIELCYHFEIYPDIWALHEWSNWLTPSRLKKRFDTIFFLASLQTSVPTFGNEKEVQKIQWETPADLIQKHHNKEILLPPPQFYELSRLINFSHIEELSEFSIKRALNGTERFLPYVIPIENNILTILPGDDMYPGEDKAQIAQDDINYIPEKNAVHRMLHENGIYPKKVITNNLKYNVDHVYPVMQNNNSKL